MQKSDPIILMLIAIIIMIFVSADGTGQMKGSDQTRQPAVSQAKPAEKKSGNPPDRQIAPDTAGKDAANQHDESAAETVYEAFLPFRHVIALKVSYLHPPLNADDDAYGPGIGGGLAYEFYGLGDIIPMPVWLLGLFAGCDADYYYYQPESEYKDYFENSSVITGGAYLGYHYFFSKTERNKWGPAVFIGYRHYYSTHSFKGETFTTNSPVAAAGIALNVYLGNYVLSVGADYDFIFEKTVYQTFSPSIRIGYAF